MDQLPLFPNISLKVSELTRYLRQLMESDEILRDIWVSGEISNFSRPSSGHIYFTLKDENAALKCVIWKVNAMRLRMALGDGMAVDAHGYISIYEPRGEYQLYVDALRLAGEGFLYQEFLRLKSRLEAEGLFDEKRKRSIPQRPAVIGIITSPTGAALQDMLNTLRRRYPLAEVVISPAAVQGDQAPGEIISALENLIQGVKPDVILLARGGGSLEDLWAFNDENVVRAVAASKIPVISGVGHETDFTLSDFAADLRAPTPTAAAEMATPDITDLKIDLQDLHDRLESSLESLLSSFKQNYETLKARLQQGSPLWLIDNSRQRLDEITNRISTAMDHRTTLSLSQLRSTAARLDSVNPLEVIRRGYAIVRKADGMLIHSIKQTQPKSQIKIQVSDGTFGATVSDQQKPAEEDSNTLYNQKIRE
jgi:exodeoxyribonuclease VII large subunit